MSEQSTVSSPATGTPDPATADGDEPLREEGLKALNEWKARAREAERKAKLADTLQAELDKVRQSQMGESEKAIESARKEGEQVAMTRLQSERVLDRVEVLAAKTFADPEDARLRLAARVADLTTGDGSPDVKAIQAALTELLKEKPHLAATPSRARGDIDQGARGASPTEFDMNRELLRATGRIQ